MIQQHVLFPLSRAVLDGSIREGETANISCDPVRNTIVIQQNHQPEVEMVDDDDESMMDTDDEELENGLKVEPMD